MNFKKFSKASKHILFLEIHENKYWKNFLKTNLLQSSKK